MTAAPAAPRARLVLPAWMLVCGVLFAPPAVFLFAQWFYDLCLDIGLNGLFAAYSTAIPCLAAYAWCWWQGGRIVDKSIRVGAAELWPYRESA